MKYQKHWKNIFKYPVGVSKRRYQKSLDYLIKKGELTYNEEIGTVIYTGSQPNKGRKKKGIYQQFPSEDVYYELIKHGVAVIPIIPEDLIEDYRDDFKEALRSFPEYKRDEGDPDLTEDGNTIVYVYPGFGALGTPSSFHNHFVRDLRIEAREEVDEFFRGLCQWLELEGMNLEMLFDRMCHRHPSMKAPREAWHRDVVPGDLITRECRLFGGWINIDPVPQYFSCVPGSQIGLIQKELDDGFASIPTQHHSTIRENKHVFEIPPGHCIMFNQYIIHEVMSKAIQSRGDHSDHIGMMRLFTGWRLTQSFEPLRDLDDILQQKIIPLPGGMRPPMYDKMHGINFLHGKKKPIPVYHPDLPGSGEEMGLIEWSTTTFNDEHLERKPSGLRVKRYMTSDTSGIYRDYDDEEIAQYTPMPL